ncbi:MAG TPA: flagellar biosynthetic protein FliO [Solimonas sp.]|nr:flagellar biosynthetic protein FliO [Solimonas sp.]
MNLDLSESLSPIAPAAAATPQPLTGKPMQAQAAPSYDGTSAGSLASMAGSLVMVLALIFAFAWLMRWLQGSRLSRSTGLRVEGGVQVGAKERVVVLQAGDAKLLLGVTAGRISLLHRYADGAQTGVDTPSIELPAMPQVQIASFSEQLQKLFGRKA